MKKTSNSTAAGCFSEKTMYNKIKGKGGAWRFYVGIAEQT